MINRMKLYVFIFILVGALIHAETYVINPMGRDIYYENANYVRGQSGVSNLRIADNIPRLSYDTDMLLHFNRNVVDARGNYRTVASRDIKYTRGVFGNNMALYFPSGISHITLMPKAGTFFSSYDKIPSFTIEFYLNPARYTIDGDIISKIGPYNENGENTYGGIRAYIKRNQLVWEFSNFFYFEDSIKSVSLSRGSYIKTGEWQHHSISYDAQTGKLVKYLNGLEEEIVYITTTGDMYGSIYYPAFAINNRNPLYIGYGYTGHIDEFSISYGYKNIFNIAKYKPSSEVVTTVIDLRKATSVISNIDAYTKIERGSSVRLFYRISSEYFLPEDQSIPWVEVRNRGSINKIGRYIQIRAVLDSDGSSNAPASIGDIKINYDVIEAPLRPRGLRAYASNGSVRLVWNGASEASSVVGYKIYYGVRSGIYYGQSSPIIIGKENEYVVENLDNNTLYYFTISAFDEFGESHESLFSEEVYARPNLLE